MGRKAAKAKMPISSAGNNNARAPRRAKASAGLTLLELLVVITILGLLAGLVGPPMGRWLDDWRLRTAAERVAQTIRYARARALFEQRYYLVELLPEKSQVRVVEPASGFVREYALPGEIEWGEQGTAASAAPLRLLLDPSGALEERTFWLRNPRGSTVKIHLDFLLGRPGVEVSPKEG